MNAISLHINYLLRHNDCVIVPGFGAFIKVRRPASIGDGLEFLPPSVSLGFNPSIVTNDMLLAHSIARRSNISRQEANSLLSAEIASWRNSLKKDGRLNLKGLGSFSLSEEDNLVFNPALSAQKVNSLFGETVLRKNDHKCDALKKEVNSPGRVFRTDKNYYIAINKTFAKVAASLAILLVVCAAITFPLDSRWKQGPQSQQTASVVPVKKISEKTAEKVLTEKPSEEAAPETPSEEAAPRYHLIVGTFHSASEADNFVSANKDKGYDLKVLPSGKVFRIAAASADDAAELRPLVNSSQFSSLFPQSWIHRQ